jgi:hypothetical protein
MGAERAVVARRVARKRADDMVRWRMLKWWKLRRCILRDRLWELMR